MTDIRGFRLPDIGEGLTEAEILRWLVHPGDLVLVNQPIVEIETAKAVVELPSPYAGSVVALLAAENGVVTVGSEIITIDTGDDGPLPSASEPEPAAKVLVGAGPSAHRTARRERRSLPSSVTVAAPPTRAIAAPPVRALARQLGVDLHTVTPTRADGRVRRDDVLAAAGRPLPTALPAPVSAPVLAPPPDIPGTVRTPIHGIQRVMADAMVRSAFTAPHVTEWVSVDVTDLLHVIDHVRHEPQSKGYSITPLLFVSRALMRAVSLYPLVNASWDGTRNEIVQFADVNLGIATATQRGLIVPNIKAAQRLGMLDLAGALRSLVTRARAGQTTLAELTHGTITITNIGVFGVDGGTPILNPGEGAILCMGQVRDMPWVVEREIVIRSIMVISLSFDHRLVDGALGSRVLGEIVKGLERPSLLLTDAEFGGAT